jgi:hypothetical protein
MGPCCPTVLLKAVSILVEDMRTHVCDARGSASSLSHGSPVWSRISWLSSGTGGDFNVSMAMAEHDDKDLLDGIDWDANVRLTSRTGTCQHSRILLAIELALRYKYRYPNRLE